MGHEAFVLHRQLRKDADVTGSFGHGEKADTVRAASELTSHSFELGKALKKTNSLWTSKLRTVLQGCAHISNHLDYINMYMTPLRMFPMKSLTHTAPP
ncbi:hypothetical protein [Streptomyces sulphureus]|uniref:hypothetical protein n=1 Tax=Streptomyces sulphureus TaxID=47758 RepID=UPI00037D084D|nr:hypothetical protein [Streptomyces sulphureus]